MNMIVFGTCNFLFQLCEESPMVSMDGGTTKSVATNELESKYAFGGYLLVEIGQHGME